ncbi:sigma factor [Pseudoclavibacter helvolus]|uniref:sigma factor n=1 Tax=Pseudoclavibacter helvolus TaxID=255205 RepID=UPI003C74CADE
MPIADGVPDPGDERLDADFALVGRGDRAALSRLYDALSPAMYALALRMLDRADHAQEATSEAWLTIWQSAPRLPHGNARKTILAATLRAAIRLSAAG